MLAYVAWQFFGTNIVAHQKQQKIVQQTQKVWAAEAGAGATGSAKGVQLNGAEALIRIPKFGKKYVMPVQKGVSDGVLAEGYGHFKDSAKAGESATTRSPRTGSRTGSRCAGCPSCGPATR